MKQKIMPILAAAATSLLFVACSQTNKTTEQAFMVEDKLFYNTNQEIYELKIGANDGEIYGEVEEGTLPEENNISNFGYYYKYDKVDEHHYDVYIQNVWYRFCDKDCELDHSENIYTEEGEVVEETGDIIEDGETIQEVVENTEVPVEAENSETEIVTEE